MRHIKMMEDDTLVGAIYKGYIGDIDFAYKMLENCFNYILDQESDDGETTESYMMELSKAIKNFHNESMETFWMHFLNTGIFNDAEGKVIYCDDYKFEVTYDY